MGTYVHTAFERLNDALRIGCTFFPLCTLDVHIIVMLAVICLIVKPEQDLRSAFSARINIFQNIHNSVSWILSCLDMTDGHNVRYDLSVILIVVIRTE